MAVRTYQGRNLSRSVLRDPLARALEDALRGGSHEPECPRFGRPCPVNAEDNARCDCWVVCAATALADHLRQEGLL